MKRSISLGWREITTTVRTTATITSRNGSMQRDQQTTQIYWSSHYTNSRRFDARISLLHANFHQESCIIDKLVNNSYQHFVIYAWRYILRWFSSVQNRIILPLNYPRMYTLFRNFLDYLFVSNGNIPSLKVARTLWLGDIFLHDHNTIDLSFC